MDRSLLWLILAFGLLALGHSLFGRQPAAEADYLFRWRYLLLLPFVPAMLDADESKRLLSGLLVLTGLSGLYGIAQVLTDSPGWLGFLHPEGTVRPLWRYVWSPEQNQWVRDGLKATGTIHNIAAFAHGTVLILLWPLASGLLDAKRVRPWQVLAALLALAGLTLSGARAAWLGLGGGLLILVCCRWRPLWIRSLSLVLAAFIGTMGLGLVASPSLQKAAGSLTGRAQIWSHCLETTGDTLPKGLGFGGHAQYAEQVYSQTPELAGKVETWCHHLPLSLAVEAPLTLIPALLLMVFLILTLTRDPPGPLQGYALACVIAFWGIAQLHDPHFQREFFPLAMLVIGCGLRPKEGSDDTDAS
ncbi:MAG: hypothetical protein CMH55_06645 [Myxococcales bacterium]|nr:hypothetical protein [Myxococcales bacterium]